ncbi:MAG: extracellular solute-binding protein [Candidatus Omnitrophica bacterium]|nr:extracellular solute-binding protein [Candidatus Omnitrophota bacterium]
MSKGTLSFRFAIVAAALLVVAGCGRSPTAKGPAPLRVWHWMTDREEAFTELARRYRQQTGTAIHFELYAPSDVYVQKVRSAAQTDGLPDIYGVLGETRDIASFINAGHVLPLEAEMGQDNDAWRSSFFPKTLAVNAFVPNNPQGIAPGVYGVPIDAMSIQLIYNKKLLAKLGLNPDSPPSMWKDFLQVGQLAKAHGVLGFVSGWAELWLIDCLATDYAIHLMGMDKVEQTYAGKKAYTDTEWLRVLRLFAELRDSRLPAEGIVTMVNKRAEQLFANEQAVFAFNGTWAVNVYRSMNPALEYGVMMLPKVKDRPMVTWGGAGSSFFINAKSPKAPQAVAFLKWLTSQPQQEYLLQATQNIPANRAAAEALPPPLAAFAEAIDAAVHPRLFAVQEQSAVIEAFDKGIQSILIGEATPEQVAEAVQSVKQRELSRLASQSAYGQHTVR